VPTDKRARQKEGRRVRLEAERKVARRRRVLRRAGLVIVVAGLIVGSVFLLTQSSSNSSATTTTTTTTTLPPHAAAAQRLANTAAVRFGCPAALPDVDTPVNKLTWHHPPAMTIDTSKTYIATFKTTTGTFVVRLDAKGAPVNVNNFVFLAQHHFYNCNPWWRVLQQFVNQSGDPTGIGNGGPGYQISQDEYPPAGTPLAAAYPAGTLAMANAGPGTNGSAFFVVVGKGGQGLPGPKYTVLGHTISGIGAINRTNQWANPNQNSNGTVPPYVTERILSVTITSS
jgi:cyclophilin family peptidyl-prolyl cis-trans isomerase